MKKYLLIAVLVFLAVMTYCQINSAYTTIGAQCGEHGSNTCEHFQSPCPEESDAEIRIVLFTDNWGDQTSWTLTDESDGGRIIDEADNLASNESFETNICAELDHCYKFTIEDSQGNGLHPGQGLYAVYWNGELLQSGGRFEFMESFEIGACCTSFEAKINGGLSCNVFELGQALVEVTGGSGPYSYAWSTGASHTTSQSLSMDDNSISVLVIDKSGCEARDTLLFSDVEKISIDIAQQAVSSIGENDGRLFAMPKGGVAPYSYVWSNGETNSEIENLTAGTYNVTVTGFTGCSASQSISLEECDNCINAEFVSDNTLFCDGTGLVQFNNTSTANLLYTWYFGDGFISNETSPIHQYTEPGSYDISLIVSNSDLGLSETLVLEDYIHISPTLVDNISVVKHLDCSTGTLGSITIDVTGGTSPLNYSWSHDNSLDNVLAEDLTVGSYEVTVSDQFGCSIVLSEKIEALGRQDEFLDASICRGDSIFLAGAWQTEDGIYSVENTATNGCKVITSTTLVVNDVIIPIIIQVDDTLSSSTAVAYQWYFEGNEIFGATDQSYVAIENGEYYVEITDANGCKSRSETVIYTSVGLEELSISNWSVFPNPTNNLLHIIFTSDQKLENMTLSIINLLGQEEILYYENGFIGSFKTVLNLNDNPSGQYFIRLKSNGKSYTESVLLTK